MLVYGGGMDGRERPGMGEAEMGEAGQRRWGMTWDGWGRLGTALGLSYDTIMMGSEG